jgi:predicted nucleic acid-binding protein
MARVLLDIDILSEYLKSHNTSVTTHAMGYAQEHGVFTFTGVTVYEIVYGFELKGASKQLQTALTWLNQNEQITPIGDDYVGAATIKAMARRQGFALELPDCLISAVAVRLQIPLVTGNTQDFTTVQKTGGWTDHRELAREVVS